jgi:hypothetical protein
MSVLCVFILCVGRDLATADPPFKKSYRLCIESRNLKNGQFSTKGCRAIIITIIIKLSL